MQIESASSGQCVGKSAFCKSVTFTSDGCSRIVLLVFYAGCGYLLLPTVHCDTDWRRQTFNTSRHPRPYLESQSYVYISHHNQYIHARRERVYNLDNRPNEAYDLEPRLNNFDEKQNEVYDLDDRLNEVGYGQDDDSLLVGFSHNPYGNSVKNSDYSNNNVVSTLTKTVQSANGNESRGKRGVIHLYNMISCATGCDPLSYKGYGCYCGFLGSGRALDGIDRCCKIHDHCYEDLFCPFFTVYLQPYFWKCYRNQPLCALENHNTRNQFINGCAARLCECDRQFAMCLQRYQCPRRRAICRSSPLRLLQNLIMAR